LRGFDKQDNFSVRGTINQGAKADTEMALPFLYISLAISNHQLRALYQGEER
jgi:hypothetical protein